MSMILLKVSERVCSIKDVVRMLTKSPDLQEFQMPTERATQNTRLLDDTIPIPVNSIIPDLGIIYSKEYNKFEDRRFDNGLHHEEVRGRNFNIKLIIKGVPKLSA